MRKDQTVIQRTHSNVLKLKLAHFPIKAAVVIFHELKRHKYTELCGSSTDKNCN